MKQTQRRGAGYIFSRLALILLLATTFFPLLMMINMSLKPTVLISTDFLSLPIEPYIQNFTKAFEFVKRPILNSLYICALSLLGILIPDDFLLPWQQFEGLAVKFALGVSEALDEVDHPAGLLLIGHPASPL